MKTLSQFAEKHNITVKVVTYRSQGTKLRRRGFDLLKGEKTIAVFEPVDYRNGDKWLLRETPAGYLGKSYAKRVCPKLLEEILEGHLASELKYI